MNDRKCTCGCGKNVNSINSKRLYVHGHQKFGKNGIFESLKFPPKCKCGCDKEAEWDWESLKWKKYIDSHIGKRSNNGKTKTKLKKQIDLFK